MTQSGDTLFAQIMTPQIFSFFITKQMKKYVIVQIHVETEVMMALKGPFMKGEHVRNVCPSTYSFLKDPSLLIEDLSA